MAKKQRGNVLASAQNEVVWRTGGGFSNPLVAMVIPVVTQLLATLLGKLKCLQDAVPETDTTIPATASRAQVALAKQYQQDAEGVISRAIPLVRRAAATAGKRQCRTSGTRYKAADYRLSDADARHLAIANIQTAIGLAPDEAASVERLAIENEGTEPVIE